ncbi:hypothetical protein JX265_009267 [Neoarthrinium moseri]|uniref:DUF6594 domain-containing protein n=1 Tax=Neoarthrinium moseri TaxID=1658444 RepID=A0A9P9WGM7_9PEZI|nr:hypothetical protein JX265_009267 [Neoarthrinium moseri]
MSEQKTSNRLKGYPFLAKLWSITQDGIARKFSHLAILNILYLQAELCHLEDDFMYERGKDLASGQTERVDCDWNWFLLKSPDLNKGSKQWQIALDIRERLEQYHSALLQYSEVLKLPSPTENQRRNVFGILGSSSLTNDGLGKFQSLDLAGINGPEVYQKRWSKDLVLLDAMEEDNDALSRWIVHPFFEFFHLIRKRSKKPIPQDLESGTGDDESLGICNYSSHHIRAVNHVVGALFAAVLPLSSIIILYKVQDMDLKVVLVCVFTILFCLAMSILSKSRRIEVVAATAA